MEYLNVVGNFHYIKFLVIKKIEFHAQETFDEFTPGPFLALFTNVEIIFEIFLHQSNFGAIDSASKITLNIGIVEIYGF